jgi:hypothetical protein
LGLDGWEISLDFGANISKNKIDRAFHEEMYKGDVSQNISEIWRKRRIRLDAHYLTAYLGGSWEKSNENEMTAYDCAISRSLDTPLRFKEDFMIGKKRRCIAWCWDTSSRSNLNSNFVPIYHDYLTGFQSSVRLAYIV